MPRPSYDAIVIGVGGVGSAALFHLASRGAKALGIDLHIHSPLCWIRRVETALAYRPQPLQRPPPA